MILSFHKYIKENYLPNDSIGYNVGKYIYHTTPKTNTDNVINNGFVPQDGVSINGEPFENRVYFATSLIAVYDLYVNFTSIRDYDDEYVIFKINSNCLTQGYSNDKSFQHGIYIDYNIDKKYIVDVIDTESLFNKFDDNDLENLYL